jgi:hypothetical protein
LGVPVALSTDDEGVSRIDLTREYVRAVETYALTYADLKELVRNSLEYSFLGGGSLWDDGGAYARVVAACRSDVSGADKPSPPCASFSARATRRSNNGNLSAACRRLKRAVDRLGPGSLPGMS